MNSILTSYALIPIFYNVSNFQTRSNAPFMFKKSDFAKKDLKSRKVLLLT